MSETHPFYKLSSLIDTYNTERNVLDVKGLQELRENISLTLFYLSDDAAKAVANFDNLTLLQILKFFFASSS